ncbi:hypothetical protein ACFQ60_05260 [Streptomyces zhihengii]
MRLRGRRERDLFGRLLPADTDGFAAHWLAAARYTAAVAESLCTAAWQPAQDDRAAAVSALAPSR